MSRYYEEEELPEFDPNGHYTPAQLDRYGEALLREDARGEICRECGERGQTTGSVQPTPQEAKDAEGNPLTLDFPEFQCENDHKWYAGEGATRGIGGENPVLFKEHFDSRKRREIYCAYGTPDPEIVSGIYNRTHPQGRKVNSADQRAKNGASYYR